MKILLIGAGKVGEALIKKLLTEKHDITVVDNDSKTLDYVVNKYDVKGILGNGHEKEVLMSAEVDTADVFIACTSFDEVNFLSCVFAKKYGAKSTIARVRNPEYFKEKENLRSGLDIDFLFNPEYRTAVEISKILRFPFANSIESFNHDSVNMIEFSVGSGNEAINKSLKDVLTEFPSKIRINAVKREDKVFIPHGDFIIEENDEISVIGEDSELSSFFKKLHVYKPQSKSVFIIGGGKTSYYLANLLLKEGTLVKIVEVNKQKCEILSDSLPKATIICADGTDQEVLEEEDLTGSNACVTLTGRDEQNVVISLYARNCNVKKVITKIDRESVSSMVEKFGLETIVSPLDIISDYVLRFIRRLKSKNSEGLKTLYKLSEQVEALEFVVYNDFEGIGIPLKDLHIKKDVVIGGIIRDGEFVLPEGSTKIYTDDRVLVITKGKQVNELSQILR